MKRYLSLLSLLCVLISFISSCESSENKLTNERLEEYSKFDYNVIWEKGDRVLRDSKLNDYYSIADVSDNEFIALRQYIWYVGEYWYCPIVLMHQDKGGVYSLDASTAQLTLRTDFVCEEENEEFWLDAGEKSRTRVLCDIDDKIAKEVADALLTKNRQYVTNEQLSKYETDVDRLCYGDPNDPDRQYLHIEFRLEGYENLIWTGYVRKADQDYFIEIRVDSQSKFSDEYVRCSEELSALLKQVEDEYGLFRWD